MPCDEHNESLMALFEYFGFKQCDDSSFEKDYDKVALYADAEGWTHAAKVIGDNVFHSKMGTAWDIQHSGGNVFAETEYGEIFAYMKRPISERYLTDMKKPHIGTIEINE